MWTAITAKLGNVAKSQSFSYTNSRSVLRHPMLKAYSITSLKLYCHSDDGCVACLNNSMRCSLRSSLSDADIVYLSAEVRQTAGQVTGSNETVLHAGCSQLSILSMRDRLRSNNNQQCRQIAVPDLTTADSCRIRKSSSCTDFQVGFVFGTK